MKNRYLYFGVLTAVSLMYILPLCLCILEAITKSGIDYGLVLISLACCVGLLAVFLVFRKKIAGVCIGFLPLVIIALSCVDIGSEPVFSSDELILALIYILVPAILLMTYTLPLKELRENHVAWRRMVMCWYYGAFVLATLFYLFALIAVAIFAAMGYLNPDDIYSMSLIAPAAITGLAGVIKIFHKNTQGIAYAVAAFGIAVLTGVDIGFGAALGTSEYYQTLTGYGLAMLLLASLFPFIKKKQVLTT